MNLFNNDYDPDESEDKDHHSYRGRELTILRGLNTRRRLCNILDIPIIKEILITPIDFNENFIESVPQITRDDLPKCIIKAVIKLSRSKRGWGIANEHFKFLLNTGTSDLEFHLDDLEFH